MSYTLLNILKMLREDAAADPIVKLSSDYSRKPYQLLKPCQKETMAPGPTRGTGF